MDYRKMIDLIDVVIDAVMQTEFKETVTFPSPVITIKIPGTETEIDVEASVANRRELFSLLFKTKDGVSIMTIPFFGHRAITDTHEDQTFIAGYGMMGFSGVLDEIEQKVEIVWLRLFDLYMKKMVSEYKSRAASVNPAVADFFTYLGGPA